METMSLNKPATKSPIDLNISNPSVTIPPNKRNRKKPKYSENGEPYRSLDGWSDELGINKTHFANIANREIPERDIRHMECWKQILNPADYKYHRDLLQNIDFSDIPILNNTQNTIVYSSYLVSIRNDNQPFKMQIKDINTSLLILVHAGRIAYRELWWLLENDSFQACFKDKAVSLNDFRDALNHQEAIRNSHTNATDHGDLELGRKREKQLYAISTGLSILRDKYTKSEVDEEGKYVSNLIKKIDICEEAINVLVRANLPLIYSFATKWRKSAPKFADKILEIGPETLMYAARLYRANKNTKFGTYVLRILKSKLKKQAACDEVVRVPDYVNNLLQQYNNYIRKNPNTTPEQFASEMRFKGKKRIAFLKLVSDGGIPVVPFEEEEMELMRSSDQTEGGEISISEYHDILTSFLGGKMFEELSIGNVKNIKLAIQILLSLATDSEEMDQQKIQELREFQRDARSSGSVNSVAKQVGGITGIEIRKAIQEINEKIRNLVSDNEKIRNLVSDNDEAKQKPIIIFGRLVIRLYQCINDRDRMHYFKAEPKRMPTISFDFLTTIPQGILNQLALAKGPQQVLDILAKAILPHTIPDFESLGESINKDFNLFQQEVRIVISQSDN